MPQKTLADTLAARTGGDGSNVYYDSGFGSAVQNGP